MPERLRQGRNIAFCNPPVAHKQRASLSGQFKSHQTLAPRPDQAFFSVRPPTHLAPAHLMSLPRLRFPLQAVFSNPRIPDCSSVASCLPPSWEASTVLQHQAVGRFSMHIPQSIPQSLQEGSQATGTEQAVPLESSDTTCPRTSRQRHPRWLRETTSSAPVGIYRCAGSWHDTAREWRRLRASDQRVGS